MATRRAGRAGTSTRLPIVLGLLLVAAYGAVARLAAPRQAPRRTGIDLVVSSVALAVALGAAALGAVMLVTVFRRVGRKKSDLPEKQYELPPFSRWSRPLALLTVLAIVAAPIVLLVVLRHHVPTTSPPATATRSGTTPVTAPPATHHRSGGSSSGLSALDLAGLGAVVVLAALGAVAWRRHETSVGPSALAAEEPTEESEPARLARSVTAGRSALQAGADHRAAIVACYAAMERELADAGTPRRPAETPVELLRRVNASGMVTSSAVRDLTELFHEARYSVHAVDARHRDRAEEALRQLDADLRSRR